MDIGNVKVDIENGKVDIQDKNWILVMKRSFTVNSRWSFLYLFGYKELADFAMQRENILGISPETEKIKEDKRREGTEKSRGFYTPPIDLHCNH